MESSAKGEEVKESQLKRPWVQYWLLDHDHDVDAARISLSWSFLRLPLRTLQREPQNGSLFIWPWSNRIEFPLLSLPLSSHLISFLYLLAPFSYFGWPCFPSSWPHFWARTSSSSLTLSLSLWLTGWLIEAGKTKQLIFSFSFPLFAPLYSTPCRLVTFPYSRPLSSKQVNSHRECYRNVLAYRGEIRNEKSCNKLHQSHVFSSKLWPGHCW